MVIYMSNVIHLHYTFYCIELIARLLTFLLVLNLINCDSKHVIVKRRARVNVRAPEWWNEWWGKYIREAIDPTVRPLLPASNSLDYDVQRPETDEEFRQLQRPTNRPQLPGPRPTFSQSIDQQGPGQVEDSRFREPVLPSPRQPSRQPLGPQQRPVVFPRPDDTTVNPPFEQSEKPVSIPSFPPSPPSRPPSSPPPSPPRTRPSPTPSRPGGNLRPQFQRQPQQPQSQFQPQQPQSQFQPQPQQPQSQFQPQQPQSQFQTQRPQQQQPVPTLRPINQNGFNPSQPPSQTFNRPSDNRQRPTLRPTQSQELGPRPGPISPGGVKGGPRPRPTPSARFPQPGTSARPTFAPLPTFNQTPSSVRPQPISPALPSPPSSSRPSFRPVPGFEARPPSARPSPAQTDIEPEVDSEEPELNEQISTIRPTIRPSAPNPRPSRPLPQQPRPTLPPPVKGRPTFVDGGRNNVPQPTFRPTVRPAPEVTTTVAPLSVQTFRPRPAVTFAPRPVIDTARPTFQPRPQLPEAKPSPGPTFRQPTERPPTKGGRRPQQPSVSFQPRPAPTTPAPFRDSQTIRPRPTSSRPIEDVFDTEAPEEEVDQETPLTLPPVPVRPTLPPRRPQSTFAPRPSPAQRPSPQPVSTRAPQIEEDQEDEQIDQEQVTTARPVNIPTRPSIPSRPSTPARPFFQPTFRPSTTNPSEEDEQPEQPEQPEQTDEPQSFGQRIPRPRPSFTPTTTTKAPRQPDGVKIPARPQPGSQTSFREPIPFRPRPIQTTTQPSISFTQDDETEPEEETERPVQQTQTSRPFRPQPTQGPVTFRPQQPTTEFVTTSRPPIKTPTRPAPSQTFRPFPPTFRPRPTFATTLAPTTTVSSITPQTFDEDYEDTQAPAEPSRRPQEIATNSPRPQQTGFTNPPSRPSLPTTTPRPSLVPVVPVRITTDRPQPIAPIDQSTDYEDEQNEQEITVPDFQPTRRPSSPRIPSLPDTQITTRPDTPQVQPQPQPQQPQPQQPQQPQPQPQFPVTTRPQLPVPSRPQQPRDEPEPRPRPRLPALPDSTRRPTSPQAPIGKQPTGKTPNTSAAIYNPPLGPAISVERPDRPKADGSMPDCTLLGANYCILTNDYPMDGIKEVVNRSYSRIKLMYEELQTVGDPDLFKSHVGDSLASKGQFACETESHMMKPGWAKDEITKEWMIIVNTDIFPQQVRTESCKRPNQPCSFVAPYYESTCQQRFSLHRLIAVDPHDPGKSPVVALFKFPAGCSCRVHPVRIPQTGEITSR
ncbi:proline-rich extensin-like protein EPR1 isoform X4 [Tetranychus urticae]|uniref:proline-rich extensin-like protein EPR1 isoform X4 n=1 Tax=Tetranychus urticae TaxID=32264 RepID=UPI000D6536E0|nr:proline-rich extensin-like protein EPR1 isoform X4 [Tetranychus urticae]